MVVSILGSGWGGLDIMVKLKLPRRHMLVTKDMKLSLFFGVCSSRCNIVGLQLQVACM